MLSKFLFVLHEYLQVQVLNFVQQFFYSTFNAGMNLVVDNVHICCVLFGLLHFQYNNRLYINQVIFLEGFQLNGAELDDMNLA